MKINRLKLIEMLRSEQDRLVNRQRRLRLEQEQRENKIVTDYVERTHEAWLQFATTIRQVVSSGGVLVPADIPKPIRRSTGYGTGLELLEPTRDKKVVDVTETLEYRKISAVTRLLEAAEDETISTYALEKAGFRVEQIMSNTTEMV